MFRALQVRLAPAPSDDVPFVVDPLYSLRGSDSIDSKRRPMYASSRLGRPPAEDKPKVMINLKTCSRCYLCERPRRPIKKSAPASEDPKALWPWARKLLLAPVGFLSTYRFFKPLEDLLFLNVPLHLIESFMARVGLTWTKLVFGLVATLTLGVVALEYFYPEPDYESEADDEDEPEPALDGDAVASSDVPSSSNESALSP